MKKTLVLCAVCAAMAMSVHAEKITSDEAVQTSSASASVSETQQQPMKIVTNCPNIRINVKKCVANGKTVMLTFKMTNVSGNDAEYVGIYLDRNGAGAYDDQGNEYGERSLSLKYANRDFRYTGLECTLLADVPATFTLKIEGVSTSAEYLARVTIPCHHNGLGMKLETPITMRNIPINRE